MNSTNNFSNFIIQLKNYLPQLFLAVIVLVTGWWLSGKLARLVIKAMEKSKMDNGIISFVNSISKAVFRIVVILVVLSTVGLNVTSIIAALGAAFVTIGIALKDSLANVAGGIVIIANKLFRVGDYLEMDGQAGTVSKIEFMFTTLVTNDNRELIIPNSKLMSESMINYSRLKSRRLDLIYYIKNTDNFEKVKSSLQETISKNDKILKDKQSKITINKCDSLGTEITVNMWCLSNDYEELKSEFQESVRSKFQELLSPTKNK